MILEFKKKKYKSAIILCGGRGTRLGKLGEKIPKTLVEVQKKAILWYIINILKFYDFNHFILPLGFKGNLIRKYLNKNNNFDIDVDVVDTGLDTDIGKRISLVEKKIRSNNFLLLNGDAIFNIDLNKIYNNHVNSNNEITFLSTEIIYQYGTIGVLGNKVKDFRRNLVYDSLKIRSSSSYKAYNYSGMSLIKTEILRKYRKIYRNSKNFEIDFFSKLIGRKKTKLIKTKGFWHSVDSIKDLDNVDKKNIFKFRQVKKIKQFLSKKYYKFL